MADPPVSPWLALERVLSWLKVAAVDPKAEDVDQARQAAADWIEHVRSDLWSDAEPPVFAATPRIVQAGILATARLFGRRDTALGIASYGEFAAGVLREDPDVAKLLGLDPGSQKPAVG